MIYSFLHSLVNMWLNGFEPYPITALAVYISPFDRAGRWRGGGWSLIPFATSDDSVSGSADAGDSAGQTPSAFADAESIYNLGGKLNLPKLVEMLTRFKTDLQKISQETEFTPEVKKFFESILVGFRKFAKLLASSNFSNLSRNTKDEILNFADLLVEVLDLLNNLSAKLQYDLSANDAYIVQLIKKNAELIAVIQEKANLGSEQVSRVVEFFDNTIVPILKTLEEQAEAANKTLAGMAGDASAMAQAITGKDSAPTGNVNLPPTESVQVEGMDPSSPRYREMMKAIGPLVEKMRLGLPLNPEETLVIQQYKPSILVKFLRAVSGMDSSGLFTIPEDNVIRVILTLKDNQVLLENKSLTMSDSNQNMKQDIQKSALNALDYKVTLYFLIAGNTGKLTFTEVFDMLYKRIYQDALFNMVNSNIVLESIQIQQVYPAVTKYALHQKSYAAPGRLNPEECPTNPRPFCFVGMPLVGSGSRNSFVFRFHGVSSIFGDFHSLGTLVLGNTINKLMEVLKGPLVIGKNNDLELYTVLPTKRLGNTFPFIFIGEVSVGGFAINSNLSHKLRSVVAQEEIVLPYSSEGNFRSTNSEEKGGAESN